MYLQEKKFQAIASDDQILQLKNAKAKLKELEAKLKIKVDGQARQKRKRENEKRQLEELKVTNPEVANLFGKTPKPGRPRLEEQQPEILKTIVDIATYGAGADERRRSEAMRTVHTLEELTTELQLRGFKVK